jgi:4-hydroxyphenylpyruvate dioxygenase
VDFTTRVLHAGYDGPLPLEVFSDAFRRADPDRVARDARRSLAALEDRLRPQAVGGRHDVI